MSQLNYTQTIDRKSAGLRLGITEGEMINSFSNYSKTNRAYTSTVSSANLQTDAVITLHNGVVGTVSVNEAADTLSTTAIAALLADAINSDSAVGGYVSAVANAAVVTITYDIAGIEFTVASGTNSVAASSVILSTGIEIPFGYGIVYGAEDGLCALPTGSGDSFAGIALLTPLAQLPDASGLPQPRTSYLPGDSVAGMSFGRCYVEVSVAVTAGEDAYVVSTGGDAGKFTNVSTSNIATGGKFSESGSDLALLQL